MIYRDWEDNEARIERAEDERERFDRHMPVILPEDEDLTKGVNMRPVLKDDLLGVEMHKPDIAQLEKARVIGRLLLKMHQPEGTELINAVGTILRKFADEPEEPTEKPGEVEQADAE